MKFEYIIQLIKKLKKFEISTTLTRQQRTTAKKGLVISQLQSFDASAAATVVRVTDIYIYIYESGKIASNTDNTSSKSESDSDKMGERSNASSTSSLALPSIPGTSPEGGASPRRAVSPLLEVRRPHCTLNCDHCSGYLEDLYKHSRFFERLLYTTARWMIYDVGG